MKKLRWAMDGGFWEVDVSTPVTVDGVARPVGGETVPLGLSRGARLSRPKQIDFFQRFMAMPFVPSFSHANGLSFQRVLSLPLHDTWFPALVGQFNVHKFVTCLTRNTKKKEKENGGVDDETFGQSIWRHLSHPNLYAFNFCLECLLTPEDTVLLSSEAAYHHHSINNNDKAVFHHKFPNHNLIVEATSPALFVDDLGKYWDVPFTLAVDLASLPSDSGASCHFCINHTAGLPKQCEGTVPPSLLLPGLSAKCAFSFKNNFDIWRSEAPKTKMVLPYDIFLSNPHISASTTLGTVIAACLGDNSVRTHHESFGFRAQGAKSAVLADIFASASLSAQHGNFQKLFLDLTRFNARVDIPSGSKFLRGASQVAFDLHNSQVPTLEAIQAICPSASLSFQQQIAGPFSFRIDAGVSVDLKKKKNKRGKEWYLKVNDPVFALEYALQVLGSAKAVAWYSPRQREFMLELRFFET
ncbi:protein trigalactosyldiacylglycerol 4 chloroplastic [Phtheirospermum japonicum]|uniref:Protein trigalactosyldiacylglycerol 4 chloroplastic n=1 Tax=Phtheirospermum japonicum TaxID=374723 RepID=A0A830BD81_9LAMI|nr:protein trigalactosyldiacylglycerol 4 chloroplastic [Phtheirospermum japonicum]